MTAIPMGARLSPPAPRPSAMGSVPKMVEKVVIRMGRKRRFAASRAASTRLFPRARSWFANSTIRMAFFVTRPVSITMPIWLKRLSEVPVSASPASAPVTASGTVKRIVSGWRKLSNCAERVR
jgi:hypothetical protein